MSVLTLVEAAQMIRDSVRDGSWKRTPLGEQAEGYMRVKRKELAPSSEADWLVTLAKLAVYFPAQTVEDFEPPAGTDMLEEFLHAMWGDKAPRTYNKNLTIIRDLFKHYRIRGALHGDPCLPIRPAKSRQVHRQTFSEDECERIIASSPMLRDRLALRLMLYYGLRKGAVASIQFKHFDHQRKRLTIFTKGGKVRAVPIPEAAFWHDLGRLLIDLEAQPNHHLLCPHKVVPRVGPIWFPDRPLGSTAQQKWWVRRLEIASVPYRKMHTARHTAGQRVLDRTKGNLKAAQALLGHASIQTTGDIYTDWSEAQLAETMTFVLSKEDGTP